MAVNKFLGQLNTNGALSTLYNMIISQEVFADNIALEGTLVERFMVDGTLYGDTKLYIATDIGTLYDFGNSGKTLLSKTHPVDPEVQAITIDTFKQTALTIDGVKLKQAFASPDIYGAFVSVALSWLRETYKILNVTLMNAYVGTVETGANGADRDILQRPVVGTSLERNETIKLNALRIGEELANLVIDLEDVSRNYNEYGFLRSYKASDFIIVWNKKYYNTIQKVALPQVFHKDGIIGTMDSVVLNERFFGTVAEDNDGAVLLEPVVDEGKQLFPGDQSPAGFEGKSYNMDGTIIAKIVHKNAIPFMSAMKTETEFYNPMDLDRNHYLTWGYSQPQYLGNYPIITLRSTLDASE